MSLVERHKIEDLERNAVLGSAFAVYMSWWLVSVPPNRNAMNCGNWWRRGRCWPA